MQHSKDTNNIDCISDGWLVMLTLLFRLNTLTIEKGQLHRGKQNQVFISFFLMMQW